MEYSTLNISEISVTPVPSITKEFAVKEIANVDMYITPGANADPLKAVSILPYSTNVGETSNPELRGSSSDYSRVMINGVPIYKPIRNEQINGIGNFGLFNPEIIGKEDVYSGNPPLKYGNSIAGLIDIRTIDNLEKNEDLILSLSLASISGFYSKNINKHSFLQTYVNRQFSSLYKNINKSSLDYLNNFKSFDLGFNYRYKFSKYLYFNIYSYVIDENYSSINHMYNYTGTSKANKKRNFNIINLNFNKNKICISFDNGTNFSKSDYDFGNIDQKQKELQVYSSFNVKYNLNSNFTVQSGFTHDYSKYKCRGLVPDVYCQIYPDDKVRVLDKKPENNNLEYYFYGKYSLNKKIIFGAGLRKNIPTKKQTDYLSFQFSAKYNITKHNSLLISVGKYNGYSIPEYQIRKMNRIKSRQFSADYSYTNRKLNVGWAIYHKIERTPLYYDESANLHKTDVKLNGLEIYVDYNLSEFLKINCSYVFLDSKFKIKDKNNGWKRYNNDMNYMVKVAFSYTNPKIAGIGLNFTCKPGQYYSPVVSSIRHDNGYIPIYGNYYSKQMNNYISLDLSVNKYFRIGKTDLVIFSSLNNVLNRNNDYYAYYNHDYSAENKKYYHKRLFYLGVRLAF